MIIFGCKEDSVTEPEEEIEISISGKVVDESGNAVENCEINLVVGKTSLNTNSDFEGFFHFSFISIFPDSFRIVTNKKDFLDQTILFQNLTEDEMRNLQVVLSSKFITISGVLTEIDENGEHPSVNTLIKFEVVIGDVSFYEIVTDQIGNFNLQVDKTGLPKTEIDEIIIEVEKQGYEPLFVYYIEPNDSTRMNISIQLLKYVNYFPLKVGNKWEYEVYRYAGDLYSTRKEGVEFWEIISVDGQNFNLDVYFTGSVVYLYTATVPIDTVIYDREKVSYYLKFENGYIKPQEDGGAMPFKVDIINFTHPYNNDGLYYYEDNYGEVSYTLLINKGILKYNYKYFDGNWGVDYRLTLLTFTEGG